MPMFARLRGDLEGVYPVFTPEGSTVRLILTSVLPETVAALENPVGFPKPSPGEQLSDFYCVLFLYLLPFRRGSYEPKRRHCS
jgi:hypothetical protein